LTTELTILEQNIPNSSNTQVPMQANCIQTYI